MRRFALALGVVVGVVAATGSGWAQSTTAQQVTTQIATILQQAAASGAQSSALSRDLRDSQGSVQVVRKADQAAKLSIISTVVGAIAADPAHAGEIVVASIGAAPGLRDDILSAAATSYPAFAPAILAAAGGAQPAAAPTRPAPVLIAATSVPAPLSQTEPADAAEIPAPSGVAAINDPFESFNRGVFAFNDVLDRFLIRPIAFGYGYVTPDPVKQSVRNFFSNLRGPVRFANDVLQLDDRGAVTTGGRFVINSTVGILGFFDVADRLGMPHHPADFGQTLNRYSVGSGPYIVLPVFGPSTVRHSVGLVVDNFLDPLTYLVDTYPRIAIRSTEAIVRREALIEPLDELRAGSLDYYAALRAAYYQDRAVALAKGEAPITSAADDAFGAFE